MMELDVFLDINNPIFQLLIAVFLGAFVGLRRELELQEKKISGFRGLRTTALVTVFGTVASIFDKTLSLPVVFFLVLTGFVFLAYREGLRQKRIGLTSEVSLLLMYWVGVLIGTNNFITGIVIALFVAISDAYKDKMHGFAKNLKLKEWSGTLQMILISLVILPFLPKTAIDRWGIIVPYDIWMLVILVSGIGFIGYFLNKYFSHGKIKGIYLTSFLGSLISSTIVTVSISQKIKEKKEVPLYFIPSILLAITVMEFRDLIIIIIALQSFNMSLLLTPIFMGSLSLILFYIYLKKDNVKRKSKLELKEKSPFEILPSLKFAVVFSIILVVVYFVKEYFGKNGIYITTFIVSLVDTESIILPSIESLKSNTIDLKLLAHIISISIVVNTLVKIWYINFFAGWKAVKEIVWIIIFISMVGLIPVFI